MKFGEIAVVDAEGAILAHTHRLGAASGGRRGPVFKKGRVLSAADLKTLDDAGVQTVWAAVLEPGDINENDAADRLASVLAGPGVRLAAAATGRVNLYATHPGLFVTAPESVDAVNLVDTRLTLATLAPYQVVERDEMIATVKVIPFAVEGTTLESAVRAAEGHAPVLRVASFGAPRVALILTVLPGVASTQLARAAAAQRQRVARLGGFTHWERRVAHTSEAVSGAITAVIEAGADWVLVLGASAMVDVEDVIPSAIRAVGGSLLQVGMPVDPGNLLVLGHKGSVPIVGVPGCARSLKRSGFDFVIERLAAGLSVSGRDIQRMGTGGLLAEIPARPRPRETAEVPLKPVAGVVLAAGRSTRMGSRNKLLEKVDGVAMVARVVDALLATRLDPVVVVLGFEANRLRGAIRDRPVEVVVNSAFAEGQGTSVAAGIRALDPDGVTGALIALGDMPFVASPHIEALLEAFDRHGPERICIPVVDGRRGNPVLWGSKYFEDLARLTGDVGGRALLKAHAADVVEVPLGDDAVHLDVDTPEALHELLSPLEG